MCVQSRKHIFKINRSELSLFQTFHVVSKSYWRKFQGMWWLEMEWFVGHRLDRVRVRAVSGLSYWCKTPGHGFVIVYYETVSGYPPPTNMVPSTSREGMFRDLVTVGAPYNQLIRLTEQQVMTEKMARLFMTSKARLLIIQNVCW